MEKIHFKVGEVYRMIRTVVLHGGLASFGGSYAVDVRSVREAVYALTTQIKGLYRAIRAGEFLVKADESISLDESELDFDLGRVSRIDIIPVPVGSKRQGLLKVILGVALIGVGFAVGLGTTISGGMLAGLSGKTFLMLGAGMFMSGIGQMISPSPTADSNEVLIFLWPLQMQTVIELPLKIQSASCQHATGNRIRLFNRGSSGMVKQRQPAFG